MVTRNLGRRQHGCRKADVLKCRWTAVAAAGAIATSAVERHDVDDVDVGSAEHHENLFAAHMGVTDAVGHRAEKLVGSGCA